MDGRRVSKDHELRTNWSFLLYFFCSLLFVRSRCRTSCQEAPTTETAIAMTVRGGGTGTERRVLAASFTAPRSSADCRVRRAEDAVERGLVEAVATACAQDAEASTVLRTVQPYYVTTVLGPKQRGWDVHVWALPGPAATGASPNPVALCMHGHGPTCCVTSWAALFAPLHRAGQIARGCVCSRTARASMHRQADPSPAAGHGTLRPARTACWDARSAVPRSRPFLTRFAPRAGFDVLALSAPCFGRSAGSARETGQANLWRADDSELVVRVLRAFGVSESPGAAKCTVLAQCMGAAMFLRALAASPNIFAPHHVLSNATIGAWPGGVRDILARQGGKFLAFHEADLDHMREAVAYKELSKLAAEEPALCRYIDNAHARARGEELVLDAVHVDIQVAGHLLSRERACFCYCPTAAVSNAIVSHLTAPPRRKLEAPHPGLQGVSAVQLGTEDSNFTVCVRVRPPLRRESEAKSYEVSHVQLPARGRGAGRAGSRIAVSTHVGGRLTQHAFLFSHVMGETASQAEVYATVAEPLLDFALAHQAHATLFAYGQTGSGKTHTIGGGETDQGIIPRLIRDLYRRCPHAARNGLLSCTYVELYNEEVRDLLRAENAAPSRVGLRERTSCKFSTSTPDLRAAASSAELAALELVDATVLAPASACSMIHAWSAAAARRATGATNLNSTSSRSHALFTVTVGESAVNGGQGKATLHIVDLAGSERLKRSGADWARRAEAVEINSSLLVLARVVSSLVAGLPHVPYRESTLTRLLADALGGSSRTALVACCSPAEDSADETVSTLRFASCATHIENKLQEGSCPLPPPAVLSGAKEEELASSAQSTAGVFAASGVCVIPGAKCATGGGDKSGAARLPAIEVFGDFDAGPQAPVVVLVCLCCSPLLRMLQSPTPRGPISYP